MSNFRSIDRQTGFLLPPSVDEWLPGKHLARFVVEVIDGLDLLAMSGSYRGSGSASYHPRTDAPQTRPAPRRSESARSSAVIRHIRDRMTTNIEDDVAGLEPVLGRRTIRLNSGDDDALVSTTLPRSTRHVGAWIEREFGLEYQSRSGQIALLHRLGLEYHKPTVIPRKLDEAKQKAFIESYENLMNSLGDNAAVLFVSRGDPK